MKEKSPAVILWELAHKERSKLKVSVFITSIGVIAGIVPYIVASRILVYLLNGIEDFKVYFLWMGIGLLSYILKSVLYSTALSVSHKATFSVLKDIRLRMIDKLPKMPLGEIISVPSGNFIAEWCRYFGKKNNKILCFWQSIPFERGEWPCVYFAVL